MSDRSGYVNQQGSRGQLYFLVGLPQASKSTYANRWAQYLEDSPGMCTLLEGDNFRPRVVVSGDDWRMALTGHEFLPNAEMVVSAFMDVAILALLDRGFDVLVDETSTSEMSLLRYFRAHPDPVPIFIDTPAEVCKQRALANNRPYLLPVIDRLNDQLVRLRANWCTIVSDLKKKVEHRLHSDLVVPAA